jgi:hypothetical protein
MDESTLISQAHIFARIPNWRDHPAAFGENRKPSDISPLIVANCLKQAMIWVKLAMIWVCNFLLP